MQVRKTFAIQYAQKILKKYNLTVPIDPINFCETVLGFTVLYIDMDIQGNLIRNKKLIGIKQNDIIVRQRFSCAHEIGHFYLHPSVIEFIDTEGNLSSKGTTKPMETEANIFASEFLMPSDAVKYEFNKINDIKKLANLFKVSETAMWIKVQDLKLI